MKKWTFIGMLIALSLLLAACGGDSGGAPVAMEKHETEALTIERPQDWNLDSVDMMGMTILVASSADVQADSILEAEDPADAFGNAPGVVVMAMPAEMAEGGGFTDEDIKSLPEEDPGVEILAQGEITVDGVEGYRLSAKGEFETMGGNRLGVYTAVLEHEATSVVFMGISPEQDTDANLEIFAYMFESIRFK